MQAEFTKQSVDIEDYFKSEQSIPQSLTGNDNESTVNYQTTLVIYTNKELEKEQCLPSEHPTIYINQSEILRDSELDNPDPTTSQTIINISRSEIPIDQKPNSNNPEKNETKSPSLLFELFPNMDSPYFPTLKDYECLKPLLEEAISVNRGGHIGRLSLICRYLEKTGSTSMGSQMEDALGHCYIGCEASERCGDKVAEKANIIYEGYRELESELGIDEHDSFVQDLKNEAIGRYFGRQNLSCAEACLRAIEINLLDFSAPNVYQWVKALTPFGTCTPIKAYERK
jgi:hypothetical protein